MPDVSCWVLWQWCQEEVQWQKKPFGSPLQKLQKLLLITTNPKSHDRFIILCPMLASRVRSRACCLYSSAELPRGTIQSNPVPRRKPPQRRGNTHGLSRYWWLAVEFTVAQPKVCNTSAQSCVRAFERAFLRHLPVLSTKTDLHCYRMYHWHPGAGLNHFFQRSRRGGRKKSIKLCMKHFFPL